MRAQKENLGNSTSGAGSAGRAMTKWRRNGCARPSSTKLLQKALSSKPTDWISNRLPLENPACHREANCRITEMHHPHKAPSQSDRLSLTLRGGTSNSIGTITTRYESQQGTTVPFTGTEVIEVIEEVTRNAGTIRVPHFSHLLCARNGLSELKQFTKTQC